MAICNSTQIIAPTECIGDSLVKINNNFSNLNNDVCSLLTLVNELSSNMMTLDVPYVRIAERVPYAFVNGLYGHVYGPSPTGSSNINIDYPRIYNVIEEQRKMTPVLSFGQLLLQPGTYKFRHTTSEIQSTNYWYIGLGNFTLTSNTFDYIESTPFGIRWNAGQRTEMSPSFEGQFTLTVPSTIGMIISIAQAYWGGGGTVIVSGGGRGNVDFVASRIEFWKIA